MSEPDAPRPEPALPACPLCGTQLEAGDPDPDFGVIMWQCAGNDDPGYSASVPYCELAGTWLSPEAWRKLAAPPLPESVAAVLRELTFEGVRAVNLTRCNRWHKGGIEEWSVSDWAVAMAGEAGEACNAVKKLRRVVAKYSGRKP